MKIGKNNGKYTLKFSITIFYIGNKIMFSTFDTRYSSDSMGSYAAYTNIYYAFDNTNVLFWHHAPCRWSAFHFISVFNASFLRGRSYRSCTVCALCKRNRTFRWQVISIKIGLQSTSACWIVRVQCLRKQFSWENVMMC